ncbi:hypothetical protein ElyMa_002663900 [Elysia marginata]|uniref:Uncharacterized protein n=1 Tax=Elysia marginata TaxID=1093978 RepID=A0AAV4HBY1_9GAST|nr:hypothetical protein ElyMa_002663900 [Elysia marginata]
MDEKEQADRLAAAEALFMISNRGEKPQIPVRSRPTRRGKKQKVVDYDDITASKRKTEGAISPRSRSRSRSKSSDGANPTSDRGRARKGLNKRGRGRGRGKKQNSIGRNHGSRYNDNSESDDNNVPNLSIDLKTSPNDKNPDLNDSPVPKAQRGRGKKRGGKSKSLSKPPKSQNYEIDESDNTPAPGHSSAVGLSGASLSKSGPSSSRSNNSKHPTVSGPVTSSGNLPSLGLVSGFNKVSLAGTSHATGETAALPSLNLSSFTEGNLLSVNLPSLPSEYPFLQLSSQPTPNLSSLGDVTVSQSMDVDTQADRGKSEKFLPLKKRKLHKADESADTPTTVATDSPVDGLSVSDSEERYEAISPEPARAPFTVQAPPIITMQTLMEIKTALQADDDGDL